MGKYILAVYVVAAALFMFAWTLIPNEVLEQYGCLKPGGGLTTLSNDCFGRAVQGWLWFKGAVVAVVGLVLLVFWWMARDRS